MKNCPKNCGIPTEQQHCSFPQCTWYVCKEDNIIFDSTNIERVMKWKASQ